MSAQGNEAPNLAALLERHCDEIAASWTDLIYSSPARTTPSPVANRLQTLELTRGSLLAIAEALRTGSYTTLQEHLANVNLVSVEAGSSIEWVVETLLMLTDAALPVILRAYPAGSSTMASSITQLDSYLRWMTAYLAGLFSSEKSRRLLARQEHAEMMLSIAREVTSSLDLDEVLARVCQLVAEAVGDCRCRLYLIDDGRPVPVLSSPQDMTPYDAYASGVVESRQPAILPRVAPSDQARDAAGCAEGAQEVLAVPFMVQKRPIAAATLCPNDSSRVFVQRDMDLAWGVANIVAPVIENAIRHQQVEQLMTRQERERLARELHDNIAQALSVLNLKVSVADGLLSTGRADPARATLREMKEVVEETYTDLREAIFNLRDSGSTGSGFLPALQEYLSDYRLHYGIDAYLELEWESVPEVPAHVRLQLIRIIQEALTNVRKHAQVSDAIVAVSVEGDWIRVCVSDKGVGFDPMCIGQANRRRYGLQTMAERAESVGGRLELNSRSGEGTSVVVYMPCAPQGVGFDGANAYSLGG
jgi:nitrate/nitrite-specific signal transduction histidine kinase